MTIVKGALVLVVILVILQLWLLTATVNAYLAGDLAPLVPAMLVSFGCLAVNLWLLRYLYRLD